MAKGLAKDPPCGSLPLWKTAVTAVTTRLSLKAWLLHASVKQALLTSCIQAVNHVVETYLAHNITSNASTEVQCFIQKTNTSPLYCADALWMKALCWSQVYDEYGLKGSFMEGLPF